MKTRIKELKKGDFFTLKDYGETTLVNENVVWIKGRYDRSSKTYSCFKFSDFNHEHFFKGDKIVYIDFIY